MGRLFARRHALISRFETERTTRVDGANGEEDQFTVDTILRSAVPSGDYSWPTNAEGTTF